MFSQVSFILVFFFGGGEEVGSEGQVVHGVGVGSGVPLSRRHWVGVTWFRPSCQDRDGYCHVIMLMGGCLVTAGVRSTREGTVLTGVCLLTLGGGGLPHPRSGWWGGYPIPGVGGGVPHPGSGWWGGTPFQVWVGGYPIPPARSEWWYPPRSGWWGVPRVPPIQTWDRVHPPPTIRTGWGTPLPIR